MFSRRKDKTIAMAEVYLHHVGCEMGSRLDALLEANDGIELDRNGDVLQKFTGEIIYFESDGVIEGHNAINGHFTEMVELVALPCSEMVAAPIEDLMLSIRTYNVLKRAGIDRVVDILHYTEDELYMVRNMGSRSLQEIKYTLGLFGLHLSEPCEWDGVEEDWAGELDMEFLEELLRAVI